MMQRTRRKRSEYEITPRSQILRSRYLSCHATLGERYVITEITTAILRTYEFSREF